MLFARRQAASFCAERVHGFCSARMPPAVRCCASRAYRAAARRFTYFRANFFREEVLILLSADLAQKKMPRAYMRRISHYFRLFADAW